LAARDTGKRVIRNDFIFWAEGLEPKTSCDRHHYLAPLWKR